MAKTNDTLEMHTEKVKSILVVQSHDEVGTFLVDAIKLETPHQALLASDGVQALEIVKTLVPDLIILAFQLPGIDGLEVADRFQAIEALKHIPILFISAEISGQELKKRHMAFLKMPFELEEFLKAIEKEFTL